MNQNKSLPTVAIVGRPNVGKSALFNAIVGKRISIVHEESGVTRDNVIAPIKKNGKYFQLIDTGGLGDGKLAPGKNTSFFDSKICSQVQVAIDSADILLFVVDVTAGIVSLDEEVAEELRRSQKKVILVVNKVDNFKLETNAEDFLQLGFNDMAPVSCLHRRGIGDLIDLFVSDFFSEDEPEKEDRVSISIVGRPNVGKSSLLNKLLGKERLIVSDIAGTTRDAVVIPFSLETKDGEELKANLIDTAGLRKRGRADTAVEVFSIIRSEEAIKKSDIVLFVIEASKGNATSQDAKIARMIKDHGKGCIVIANKWDMCSGTKQKDFKDSMARKLPFVAHCPVVFTSAISGYNFKELTNEILLVHEQSKVKVPTSTVNTVLADAVHFNPPPCIKGRFFKIFYATMVHTVPPIFKIFVNDPKLCPSNYEGYLNNYLRKCFNFRGFPIKIKLVQREDKKKK